MDCPNCGSARYTPGTSCKECGFEPVKETETFKKEKEEAKKQRNEEAKSNLWVSIGIGVFFGIVFWIFPTKRRGGEWFEFTTWDFVGALFWTFAALWVLSKKETDGPED